MPPLPPGKAFDDLPLGLGDLLAAAELADVGGADVQYETDLRRDQTGEVADVADIAGAHFEDEVLGVLAGSQRGQRQADLVVEIACRVDGGAFALEELGDEVLGAGLAGRAGERDRGGAEAFDDGAREGAERGGDVRHDDRGYPDGAGRQHGHRTRRHGAPGVVVAVDVLAGEGGEETAGLDRAGVDHDGTADPCGRIRYVVRLPADDFGDLGERGRSLGHP